MNKKIWHFLPKTSFFILSARGNKVKSSKIFGGYGAEYHINTWLPMSRSHRTWAGIVFIYLDGGVGTQSKSLGWLGVSECQVIFELPDKSRNLKGAVQSTPVKIFSAKLEAKGKGFQK